MTAILAFTGSALLPEVVQLQDGRLAARRYNSRMRKWGWLVEGGHGLPTQFFTDKQWSAR